MIELDVISYLKNDATLYGLIGATAEDPRIYPVQSPPHVILNTGVLPHIIYNVISEGTTEENILEMAIQFNVRSANWSDCINIAEQLYVLLDRQDQLQGAITSADYYLYWSKIVGGTSDKEPEQNGFTKGLNVEFKYHLKNRIV